MSYRSAGEQYTPESNTIFYAMWVEISSIVAYIIPPVEEYEGENPFKKSDLAPYSSGWDIPLDYFVGSGFNVIAWNDVEGNAYTKDTRHVKCRDDGGRIELTATIEFWTVTIEFHNNVPEEGDMKIETFDHEYKGEKKCNVSAVAPHFVRDGYKFSGWSKTSTGEPLSKSEFTISEMLGKTHHEGDHIHLYAIWTLNTS